MARRRNGARRGAAIAPHGSNRSQACTVIVERPQDARNRPTRCVPRRRDMVRPYCGGGDMRPAGAPPGGPSCASTDSHPLVCSGSRAAHRGRGRRRPRACQAHRCGRGGYLHRAGAAGRHTRSRLGPHPVPSRLDGKRARCTTETMSRHRTIRLIRVSITLVSAHDTPAVGYQREAVIRVSQRALVATSWHLAHVTRWRYRPSPSFAVSRPLDVSFRARGMVRWTVARSWLGALRSRPVAARGCPAAEG
jgi:hypothetical protein